MTSNQKNLGMIAFQKNATVPGVYPDMTNEEYHKDSAIGSSAIKEFYNECPLHFYKMYVGPKSTDFRSEVNKSKNCELGTDAHFLLLEPERFKKQYEIAPSTYCNGKGEVRPMNKNSNFWKDLKKTVESEGRRLVTYEDLEKPRKMVNSIISNPEIKAVFSGGFAEYSFFAEDPETGLMLKAKPDYLKESIKGTAIIDYKSTAKSLSVREQNRAAKNDMRHIQGPFHRFVTELALTKERNTPTVISDILYAHGSQKPPYLVDEPWRMPDSAIHGGDIIRRVVLKQIKKCLLENHWPNHSEWGHMLNGDGQKRTGLREYEYSDWDFNQWDNLEERFLTKNNGAE